MQLLLLLWAIFTGLLEAVAWTKAPPRRAWKKSLAVFVLLITLAELGCNWLLYNPRLIPGKWFWAFENYYSNYQRDVLQFDKKLSTYDAALFYRLKSNNRGLFRNFEFSDSIVTNNMGFRNDPISMDKLSVICLGDSYTVGWGVGQEEAYPQQLEKIIKAPVLNTGVSSYGTAREVESIRRLDTRSVKTIIIQYSNNDAEENEAYVKNNYRLPISPESVYDSICNEVKWSMVYFPGKSFCTISKMLLKEELKGAGINRSMQNQPYPTPVAYGDHDARLFIEILKRSGWDFDKLQVIVFHIDEDDSSIPFVPALARQLSGPENAAFFKGHIHLLYIAGLLAPTDHYAMDPHLRASGQKKIAQALAGTIDSLSRIPFSPSMEFPPSHHRLYSGK